MRRSARNRPRGPCAPSAARGAGRRPRRSWRWRGQGRAGSRRIRTDMAGGKTTLSGDGSSPGRRSLAAGCSCHALGLVQLRKPSRINAARNLAARLQANLRNLMASTSLPPLSVTVLGNTHTLPDCTHLVPVVIVRLIEGSLMVSRQGRLSDYSPLHFRLS